MARYNMKKSRGGAYVMVVVAALMVLTLVLAVLSVTAVSRNLTARYEHFFGLYDLAVAGNEQAFETIREVFSEGIEAQYFNALLPETHFSPVTIAGERHTGQPHLPYNNGREILWEYRHYWGLEIFFDDITHDLFSAFTIVYFHDVRTNGLYIRTVIHKYEGTVRGHATEVRSRVNFLDDGTLEMVELMRTVN